MTIDINTVNFVEHAELLDVVLDNMQPGHIIHIDVADQEYAFLKTTDELLYINIDDHIPPYKKKDIIKLINGKHNREEKEWREEIKEQPKIDEKIEE